MHFKQRANRIGRWNLLAAIFAGMLLIFTYHATRGVFKQGAGVILQRDDHGASPGAADTIVEHKDIVTTVFWVGEEADAETNDSIHNISSVWVEDWKTAFGGIDDPSDRCGYKPCGFKPKENAFYFALPFNDYNSRGLKPASKLKVVPWYDGTVDEGESILKNRWIEITYQDKKAYAQWEDVGPFGENDASYVFGTDQPKEKRAGLDVSPAVADYLGIDGRGETSWKFVGEPEVPSGPWTEVITASGPQW